MIKKTLWFKAAVVVYFCFSLVPNTYSKLMRAPTFEEAVEWSKYIAIAEYSQYSIGGRKITYFDGPRATYKVIEILKGETLPETIEIQYKFTDGSACLRPKDWLFNDKIMPQKGSRWILFLLSEDHKEENAWITYRGDYGRWTLTDENLNKIKNRLKTKSLNEAMNQSHQERACS